MTDKFYVYLYTYNQIPFYVGKGTGIRFRPERHLNSKHYALENKLKKIGIENVEIEFLHKNISEEEALLLEKFYISAIGRRNNGTGILLNLTDGGEGSSGHIQSETTKNKRSLSMKKAVAEGRVFTKEHRQKISQGRKGLLHTQEAKAKMQEHHSIGERSKLKEQDVRDIMKQHELGVGYKEIAKNYNVCKRHIYNIVKGYRWKQITKEKENG